MGSRRQIEEQMERQEGDSPRRRSNLFHLPRRDALACKGSVELRVVAFWGRTVDDWVHLAHFVHFVSVIRLSDLVGFVVAGRLGSVETR